MSGDPVNGIQNPGKSATGIAPVLIGGVDGNNILRTLLVSATGALVPDFSGSAFVTVQTGAPASTYITPLVYDQTAISGGLYGWTGSTYTKIGGLAS